MTLDEACLYLGLSPDDEDLDLDELERKYESRISIYDPSKFFPDTPEYEAAKKKRALIEEAYDYMLDVYVELYGDELESESESESHEPERSYNFGALFKLAAYTVMVAGISFAVFIFFMKSDVPTEKTNQREESVNLPAYVRDYERVLRELEDLKSRTISHPQNNNITDYADLVERVMPAIVRINTERSTGSGFFVSPNGDILTNYHVIQNAGNIRVVPQNGVSMNASVKDYDSERDIALLVISTGNSTPFLKISADRPRQGEAVIAIGNPRGLSGTVSNGIISAFREMNNNSWIQFTAPVSPGSSGGALLNLQGEVVGMPTMLLEDGQNLNFAIPPDVLSRFFMQARNKPVRVTPNAPSRRNRNADLSPENNPGLIFVMRDESYETYLETEHIEFDRERLIASFIMVCYPTERMNERMKRDSSLNPMPGRDFGPCIMLYVADFSDNTYIHLRTINLYDDGTIARDYERPQRQIQWERVQRWSRIESVIRSLRKYLHV